MIFIVFMSLCVPSRASPTRSHQAPNFLAPIDDIVDRNTDQNLMNIKSLWFNVRRDLEKVFRDLETVTGGLGKDTSSSEGVDKNNYKIILPLTGFLKDDIVINASMGVVMVQAVHKVVGGPEKNYSDIWMLPKCVSESVNWSYENGVLEVLFPLIKNCDSDTKGVTTVGPDQSHDKTGMPRRKRRKSTEVNQ